MTVSKITVTKIPPNTKGRDFNFFQKKAVSSATFGSSSDGYLCDMIIDFPIAGLILHTEGTSTNTVEYSFNGNTVHGELIPGTNRATITFLNRKISAIWFRVKSGSTGPITVSVEAWANS